MQNLQNLQNLQFSFNYNSKKFDLPHSDPMDQDLAHLENNTYNSKFPGTPGPRARAVLRQGSTTNLGREQGPI